MSDTPGPTGYHRQSGVDATKPAAPRDGRRLVFFALTVVILLLAAFRLYGTVTLPEWQPFFGTDLIHYELAVDRWLATGSPYPPDQVAAPFDYDQRTFLHPPISLPFFLVWKVVPWPLYWILPLGLLAFVVGSYRPRPWTWPLMALPLLLYPIGGMLISGNTDLWAWGIFAAGVKWGWPVVFLALKPSVALGALVGIRHRWTWIAGGLVLLACLPFGGLWIDWAKVMLNSPASLFYSAGNVWMFAIPLLAKLGSQPLSLPRVTVGHSGEWAYVAIRRA